MATVADLRGVIMRAAIPVLTNELDAFGKAAAAAMQSEAPFKTGDLRKSIKWRMTGPLSGQWTMRAYAVPVQFGHPVAKWGTAKHRTRPYKTKGFVAANPFLDRGVQSASPGGLTPEQVTALRAAALKVIAALRS